jgi:hypothetical protein
MMTLSAAAVVGFVVDQTAADRASVARAREASGAAPASS